MAAAGAEQRGPTALPPTSIWLLATLPTVLGHPGRQPVNEADHGALRLPPRRRSPFPSDADLALWENKPPREAPGVVVDALDDWIEATCPRRPPYRAASRWRASGSSAAPELRGAQTPIHQLFVSLVHMVIGPALAQSTLVVLETLKACAIRWLLPSKSTARSCST